MRRLQFKDGLTAGEKRYAVEAALLLGFQSETAVFPVLTEDGDVPVPKTEDELLALWNLPETPAPEGYTPAEAMGPVFELDFRKKTGLENLFSKGAFLKDEDHDLLPDRLDVKLVLPEDMDRGMLTAACNIAFRFGMETTGFTEGIVAEDGYEGNAVIFENAEEAEVVLEEPGNAVRVHIRGMGEALATFSSLLCEKFPLTKGMRNWRDALMDMTDDFALRGADGQLAYLASAAKETGKKSFTVYGAPELTEEQKKHFPDAEFLNCKAGRKVREETWELPWEVDVLENELKQHVLPFLEPGDRVRIEGAVSEDKDIRERLAARIENAVREKSASLTNIQLICAYKQGYSWIDETVIPALEHKNTEKIEIFFKPFLPEGQTEWLDENGATPSYHNLKADDPDRWYDLPIRFLQELYPIEDQLIKRLGIARENIIFTAYEGEENLTYLCRAVTKNSESEENAENKTQEFRYLVRCSERPYLDTYPQLGKVHPSTGYLRVWVNDEVRINRLIPTDMEQVWDVYQKKVLPQVRAFVEEKTGGKIDAEAQPFFQQLVLDVSVSEPDYRTGSREDLISALDALHEDLYFVGSDYFKNYGIQKADVLLDAPGLILPQIHNREGKPVFQMSLYERLAEKASIVCEGKELFSQRKREEVSLHIRRIYPEGGTLGLEIETAGVPEAVLESYARLLSEGILENSHLLPPGYVLRFVPLIPEETGKMQAYTARIPSRVPTDTALKEPKKITDIDLHENELIGYDTYLEIIENLKGVEGIEVFRTTRSYLGRELYAIWLSPGHEGYLSMTKRLSRCPSEIINARHHANEVSSTNAAFILLKRLLTEKCYEGLSEKLNLVLVPMENVDGAAIHYELQKEHPYWKFHVARFNAIGKEFYHDHFRQDTIHGEAMGLTRLFEKYVPDMIVDNHGVPSHEWEQQFSGYTSPSYKGFWLPRSLLYGYFWYVTNPEYVGNYAVNKKMEDVIADKIAEDKEMTAWNLAWSAQFEKYAHAWMPRLFPANYYKDMINYWIPFAYDGAHRYPSIRFPWITTVAYTSEVADETAQGAYLNLCARAHVAHDEATIQMLTEAAHVYTSSIGSRDGQIFAEYRRQRPMVVGNSGKI